jgi:predicted choloylglycine hydrolase
LLTRHIQTNNKANNQLQHQQSLTHEQWKMTHPSTTFSHKNDTTTQGRILGQLLSLVRFCLTYAASLYVAWGGSHMVYSISIALTNDLKVSITITLRILILNNVSFCGQHSWVSGKGEGSGEYTQRFS